VSDFFGTTYGSPDQWTFLPESGLFGGDWHMKISAAIDNFQRLHPRFCPADKPKILQVLDELLLSDDDFELTEHFIFDSNWENYPGFTPMEQERISLKKLQVFDPIQGLQGTIRIYPTMILAKKSFRGSRDRGPSNSYPVLTHHCELTSWSDKSTGHSGSPARNNQVKCPEYSIWVPKGMECMCGETHT